MNLRDIIRNTVLKEGGNVSNQSPGWQGVAGDHQAQELDLNVHDRAYVQDVVADTLTAINNVFAQQFKEPLWHENSVKTQKFLSGSTFQFMDKKIPDAEFVRVKPKVGDIDTQAPDKHADTIKQFLQNNLGKLFGNAKLLGYTPGNSQWVSLWEIKLKDLPVKIQIDFEYGAHDNETGLPTDWQSYSHSSSWDDLSQKIKGVFHKYLDRALPYAQASTKYVARVLKKSTKISDAPVTDSDYSFAVSGPGGGGVSRKYIPYNDPATGQPMEKDGVPVMQLLDPANRQYIQNLSQQFEIFFGQKPTGKDQQLKNSFVGTVSLANKYLDDQARTELFNRFVGICFEPGSQMITKDDPTRDRDIKFAAIDWMIEHLKLPNAKAARKQAIDTAMAYEQAFTNKKAAKQPAPVNEAEEKPAVQAQLRKGMPHLRDLKPADFLDLVDEMQSEGGRFKLQNIPLNVKIDGFGGRFGKNAEGKPFMGTSRTEPRYEAGFVKYHQQKGTTDPEILGRAANFDKLFNEMMNAIKAVDARLGEDFLVDKQVTCEVLFLPFATKTDEGRLKFVGIEYDQLPEGVDLVLVPFRVVEASTGEDLPNANEIVSALTELGHNGSVAFMSNKLAQKEALDVTEIINVLDNIDELKSIVSSTAGKRDRASVQLRREVEEKLKPVQIELERAIDEDPNIVGKDLLGQDYEGIVINSRLGPVKVTSQKQKDIITAKNAAKINARTERPRENTNKTAVVAIGSFVGHVGHEQLFDYTVKKAAEVGGDPYLFIGNAQGKDDPIPPSVKVQTWHKMYPEYAKNISTVTQEGGSLMQKIKHELINPLPGKPPRYDNIIIMVGEDQAKMPIASALMKAVNKFPGYEHVKASLEATPRGTGMSFTKLRNILKDPNATPEQQLQVWSQGFDVKKLGVDWIKHLMDITRKGMGVQNKTVGQQPPERLSNALIRPKQKPTVQEPDQQTVSESPIEMDPAEPMNPTIYGHQGVNPAELKTRMMRAKGQLTDLAQRAQNASPLEWESIARHFSELAMNIEQIRHALDELAKIRKRGGIKSRGIDPNIGEGLKGAIAGGAVSALAGPEAIPIGMEIGDKLGDLVSRHRNEKNKEKDVAEELDRSKRIQIIRFLAKTMGWGISDLELAKDSELVYMYKKVKSGEHSVEEAGSPAQQAAIAIAKKKEQGVAEGDPNAPYTPSPAKPFRNPKGFNKQGTGVGNKLAQQTRAELAKKKEQGVAEGAPIVVMPSHKRLEKKHKPSLSRGMDPAKAQGEQDARDGKPYNNPYPFKKELGAPGNWEHNSYKASYDSVKKGVAEEKQRLDPKCWSGKHKEGTKIKGGVRVNNCVPVSEDVENIMAVLIDRLIVNEAISYNQRRS